MTRKMAYVGAAYLLALFFASYFHFKVLFIVGAVAIGAALFAVGRNNAVSLCLISAAAAVFIYGAAEVLCYYPLVAYDGSAVTIEGKVESFSVGASDMSSYTINGRIVGGPKGSFNIFGETLQCNYDDVITASGIITKPKDSYTFPAESYNKAQGIFLEMSFPTAISIERHSGFSLKQTILSYRDYLYEKIVATLPGREGAALVAILCSDKSGLDDDTKTVLYRAGIGHIMSVSGMHLTIVSAIVLWILDRFRMNKWLRFAILEVLMLGFVIFAGLSNSVLRSAVMLTCVYGAGLFRRRADSFSSLGISVIVLTILTPFAVRDASFLLSVTGVFGIAVLAPMVNRGIKWRGIIGKIGRGLATSLCVTFTVFPVSFLFFDEISIISPLSNLLLVPICTAALFCGFIVMLTGGAAVIAFPLLLFAGVCCKVVLAVCDFIGRLGFAYIPIGYDFLAACTAILLFGVLLVYIVFRRKRAVIFMTLLSVPMMIGAGIIYSMANRGILTIAVLGDSKSSALIVHDSAGACIFDLKSGKNVPRSVQKYLTGLGIDRIDILGMLSRGEQLAPAYEKRLSFCEVGEVLASSDSYIESAFGMPVEKFDGGADIAKGNCRFTISGDNTIEINYGSFSFLAISERENPNSDLYNGKKYSVVCVYEGKQALPVSSGSVLFLDEKAGLAGTIPEDGAYGFLITCKQNGAVKIRGIKNGGRQ